MTDLGAAALAWVKREEGFEPTLRQLAILTILCDRPGPHRVRALAKEVGVGKPVITRAINTFLGRGLAQRVRDDGDLRDIQLYATVKGMEFRRSLRRVEA